TLPGCYTFKTSYVGYKIHETIFNIGNTGHDSVKYNLQLTSKKTVLKEVLITAIRDASYFCCCCQSYTIYCTNHRFKTDSIPPVIQSAPAKWYNMNVYPNPTANRVNLTANTAIEEPVQLQILDAAGKLVLQQQLDFRNQADYTFDLSPYRHGSYFFRMQYMGETHVEKVLKLR
ncbi:MAG: T9SS type A sorting domain-containing protein, partial [Bacteroidia bacterium]